MLTKKSFSMLLLAMSTTMPFIAQAEVGTAFKIPPILTAADTTTPKKAWIKDYLYTADPAGKDSKIVKADWHSIGFVGDLLVSNIDLNPATHAAERYGSEGRYYIFDAKNPWINQLQQLRNSKNPKNAGYAELLKDLSISNTTDKYTFESYYWIPVNSDTVQIPKPILMVKGLNDKDVYQKFLPKLWSAEKISQFKNQVDQDFAGLPGFMAIKNVSGDYLLIVDFNAFAAATPPACDGHHC